MKYIAHRTGSLTDINSPVTASPVPDTVRPLSPHPDLPTPFAAGLAVRRAEQAALLPGGLGAVRLGHQVERRLTGRRRRARQRTHHGHVESRRARRLAVGGRLGVRVAGAGGQVADRQRPVAARPLAPLPPQQQTDHQQRQRQHHHHGQHAAVPAVGGARALQQLRVETGERVQRPGGQRGVAVTLAALVVVGAAALGARVVTRLARGPLAVGVAAGRTAGNAGAL